MGGGRDSARVILRPLRHHCIIDVMSSNDLGKQKRTIGQISHLAIIATFLYRVSLAVLLVAHRPVLLPPRRRGKAKKIFIFFRFYLTLSACAFPIDVESEIHTHTMTDAFRKVFVGNLVRGTTDDDLRSLFATIGPMYVVCVGGGVTLMGLTLIMELAQVLTWYPTNKTLALSCLRKRKMHVWPLKCCIDKTFMVDVLMWNLRNPPPPHTHPPPVDAPPCPP